MIYQQKKNDKNHLQSVITQTDYQPGSTTKKMLKKKKICQQHVDQNQY